MVCGRRQELTYKDSLRKYSAMEASSVEELIKKLSEGKLTCS